jgi:D-alanyl-D-alanine carboxypeptidase/D-alanyl-D-alanine-endopeptidase (penicillin-binding protein 4)
MVKYVVPLSVLLLHATTAIAQGGICRAQLGERIDQLVNQPDWTRSRFGILLTPPDETTPLYELGSNQFFIPASNGKILTTAAALATFGPEYRIPTPIYTLGEKLIWVGQGDPSLDRQRVEFIARKIAEQRPNLKYLEIVDNYFPEVPTDPTWEWSDLAFYYGSPVTSVIYNENAFDLVVNPGELGEQVKYDVSDAIAAKQWQITNEGITVAEGNYGLNIMAKPFSPELTITGTLPARFTDDKWGMSVPNPSIYLGDTLQLLLQGHGVALEEVTHTHTTPTYLGKPLADYQPFDVLYSPPIAELIADTNLPSNNLYAETLFQQVGVKVGEPPSQGIGSTLETLGVNPNSYRLADGSGLSRHNLVSPQAIVDTLQGMAHTAQGDQFKQSLPVAGVSGTLRYRFQDSPLTGKVWAKTGTLTGTSALSGYVDNPHYGLLTFSIMVNNSDQPTSQQRATIDQIVTWFYNLDDC